MCSNFTPSSHKKIKEHYQLPSENLRIESEVAPTRIFAGGFSPLIKLNLDGEIEAFSACFGLIPPWSDIKLATKTYNARSETIHSKPSFRHAWKNKQFCIIPAHSIYEPCYETGKNVWWEIRHAQAQPLSIAGIYEIKTEVNTGQALYSFSMMTLPAKPNSLMSRFHKPSDEKRKVALLKETQYKRWLQGQFNNDPEQFTEFAEEDLFTQPILVSESKQFSFEM